MTRYVKRDAIRILVIRKLVRRAMIYHGPLRIHAGGDFRDVILRPGTCHGLGIFIYDDSAEEGKEHRIA